MIASIKKDIKKFESLEEMGSGSHRDVRKSSCGKYAIKRGYSGEGVIANQTEVDIWKKSGQSWLLNQIVWASRDFKYIIQPICEVVEDRSYFCSIFEKYFNSKYRTILNLDWDDPQDVSRISRKKNPRIQELVRLVQKVGMDGYDLHQYNWGLDLIGRLVIIDYGWWEKEK